MVQKHEMGFISNFQHSLSVLQQVATICNLYVYEYIGYDFVQLKSLYRSYDSFVT